MYTFLAVLAAAASFTQPTAGAALSAAVALSAAATHSRASAVVAFSQASAAVAPRSAAVIESAAVSPSQASAAMNNIIKARGNGTDIFCDPESAFTPWYRAYNGAIVDHFYTTSESELQNAVDTLGYTYESIPGNVLTAESCFQESAPLYRLYNPTIYDHFYTTSLEEADNAVANLGYSREGTQAYVYTTQVCGSIPLYRTYDVQGTDHFYTTNEQEYESVVASGFANEGITGYIMAA